MKGAVKGSVTGAQQVRARVQCGRSKQANADAGNAAKYVGPVDRSKLSNRSSPREPVGPSNLSNEEA